MRPVRKKMGKPDLLGNILGETLKASKIGIDLELHRLWKQWADLVGPAIAHNTRPAAIKGKLLLVNVSSAPWMQQLQYLKDELIAKLNAALDKEAVQDIRFRVGPVEHQQDRSDLIE
jgi:predicted nucleic acid-binding Zn ribbon protein